MIDIFDYKFPFGFFGKLAETLFLEKYMTGFLIERNQIIKEFAESKKWRLVLQKQT